MLMLDLNKSAGVLDLSKQLPSFNTIKGVLNWEPNPVHGVSLTQGFDLDIFAFVLDSNEKIAGGQDVVYFNNKNYQNGAVEVPVDNRTGEGVDDEFINVSLSKVPADKKHIDIYVFIHEGAARNQSFGMIANAGFVLSDVEGGKDLVRYSFSSYTNETALHIGRFTKESFGWTFNPTGDVAAADPNQVVAAYL